MGFGFGVEEATTRYTYSDERRHNPELQEKVVKVREARKTALREADELLQQAARILTMNSGFVGDEIYQRQVQAVRIAAFSLHQDAEFANRPSTQTSIENAAAGPLGEQIEQMGNDFPL